MHHGDVSPEIAAGLLALKKRIAAAKIPPSQLDQTINVAVWNIREFGKKRRTLPAIHYIAEILGQFDLIIGSDLLYEQSLIAPLAAFIHRHARDICEVVIVDPGREHRGRFCRSMASHGFACVRSTPTHGDHLDELFHGEVLTFTRTQIGPERH